LSEEFGVGPAYCGYIYSLTLLSSCIGSPVIGYLVKEKLNKKTSIFVGLLGGGLCFILIGPDERTGLQSSLMLTTIASIFL